MPKDPEPALSTPPSENDRQPTVIRPPQGWHFVNLRELWHFRDLLFFLTWRDVKVRYKQTVLGAAWAVLQPAMMMVVFGVFFGRMAGVAFSGPSYSLFAYAGLLPWIFFATAIGNAGNSVIGSERLVTKVYFPRLAIPFAAVGAAVVDFLIAFVLLLGLMLYYQALPGISFLLLPVIFAILMLGALGVGIFLAALNVAYRDFRYVMPFMLQVWMFATPSIYMTVDPSKTESGLVATFLTLNPLTGLIANFRAAALGEPINWLSLGIALVVASLAFIGGCTVFRKIEDSFADII